MSTAIRKPLVRDFEDSKIVFEAAYIGPNIGDLFDYEKNVFKSIHNTGHIGVKMSVSLAPKISVPDELIEHPVVKELSGINYLNTLKISFGGLNIKYETAPNAHSSDNYSISVKKGSEFDDETLKAAKNLFLVKDML